MAWLTGWSIRNPLPIPSSGWSLSGDVTDFTIEIPVTSALAAFWAAVKSDGGDVRFTTSDGTTLLKKVTVKFDSTGDSALYLVKIPTLAAASDPTIYLYAGNASASTDDDNTNAFKSTVRAWFALDLNYSGGAFVDLKNGLSGTNSGTTDVADQLSPGRGRAINCTVPNDISVSDNDLLSFGNGTTDTDMSIVARVKMTDATKFRICSRGVNSSTDFEYYYVATAADTLAFLAKDVSTAGYVSRNTTDTVTADEGTWVRLAVTKTGTTINHYRNGTVMAMGSATVSSYTAMENGTGSLYIGSYYHTAETSGSGDIGELVLLAEVISTDWMKCYEYSSSGSWISWGGAEYIYEATGGAIAGGSSDYLRTALCVADGGAIAGGSVAYLRIMFYDSSGGGIVGGNADYTFNGGAQYTMDGGGIAGGSADYTRVALFAATGGAVAGGTAPYSFTISSNIQEVIWELYDAITGDPITGVSGSTTIKFRRTPDGKIYDWADSTFKSSGWTSITSVLAEKDATNLAGLYVKEIDVATLDDGRYQIFVGYTASSPKQRGSIEFLVKDGAVWDVHTSDNVDVASSTRLAAADFIAPDNAGITQIQADIATAQTDITSVLNYAIAMSKWKNNKLARTVAGTTETWVLYDDDSTTPLLTWTNNTSTRVRTKAT